MDLNDLADDQEAIVMCSLREGAKVVVSGSSEEICAGCQAPIWLSPQGQGLRARHANTTLKCTRCMGALAQEHPEIKLTELPGAIDAVQKEFGTDIRAAVDYLKSLPIGEIRFEEFE